jgi:hypothetical protein
MRSEKTKMLASASRRIAIAFLLALVACATASPKPEGEMREFRHPNGKIAAAGRVTSYESDTFFIAPVEHRPVQPWQQHLRSGPWQYFDESGALRAEVSYRVAWYEDCCVAGLCKRPYEVVDGVVRLYAPDGTQTYDGRAKNRRRLLQTNCQGGDWVTVSTLPLPNDIRPDFAQSLVGD